jgi:hypothetical protein
MNDSTEKSGRKVRKIFKYTGVSLAGIFPILLVSHLIWENSGSNEWQVVSDKSGVRVSTLKTPGETLLKYRVNMHIDSRLSDVVFYLSSTTTGSDVGAIDVRRIEEVSADPVFYAYDTYKLDMPPPWGRVQVMMIGQYHQDPQTKRVDLSVLAAPNRLPLDNDVRRIVHLSNNWTLTPAQGGGVEIESVAELDLGLPYVLANLAMPGVVNEEFNKMREVLKRDKYRNRTVAFVTEPPQAKQLADTSAQSSLRSGQN